MIDIGQNIPSAKIFQHSCNGPEQVDLAEYFSSGVTVLVGLPAAFSPTCTDRQLPGYVRESANFKAAGADRIACLSVNDSYVMNAWGNQLGAVDSGIDMIADSAAEFTRAIGADVDLSIVGLQTRSKRYAMIIKDGVVKSLAVEDNPGDLDLSSAEKTLEALKDL